tara:strand:- start:307 stop:4779 length:4473 start_codon:yes stop_codon:yes gene_type:complete
MALKFGPSVSLEEINKKQKEEKDKEEVGFFESALAGVATGLWNIPKGIVSLGAEIYDLTADTNLARDVEEWFDNVNPFDDEAEARTVGKITQALTQIGLPAYAGARIGVSLATKTAESLAKKAVAAKQAGKVLSLSRIGAKIMSPTGRGIIGAGVGEALVTDEDIGTFADIVKGTKLEPFAITMLDREDKQGREDALRRLKNRLKFGTEGALFNLALVGAGKGIQKLRGVDVEPLDEFAKTAIGRDMQRYGPEYGFRPEGFLGKSTFEIKEFFSGQRKAAVTAANNSVKELDTAVKNVSDEVIDKFITGRYKLKSTNQKRELFREKLQQILSPDSVESQRLLKNDVRKSAVEKLEDIRKLKELDDRLLKADNDEAIEDLTKLQNNLLRKNKDVGGKGVGLREFTEKVRREGIFKPEDYIETKDLTQLKNIIANMSGKSGKEALKEADPLLKSLRDFRLGVDNMSAKSFLLGKNDDSLKKIGENFGRYMTTVYQKYEQKGLKFLTDFKTTDEMFKRSKRKYIEGSIKTARRKYVNEQIEQIEKVGRKATPEEILKFKNEAAENIYSTRKELVKLIDEADNATQSYAKKIAADEVSPYDLPESNISKTDLTDIKVDDSILKNKKVNEWQEELFGVIKDPSYTFFSTVGKQANLNFTTDYLNRIAQVGKTGKNPFVYDPEEIIERRTKQAKIDREAGYTGPAFTREQNQILEDGIRSQVKKEFGDATKWKKYVNDTSMPNDLDNLYIKAPQYEGILDVTSNWLNRSNVGTFYKYSVLLPKAGSQIAKTILSPLTHVRNVISAGAFVSANGAFFPNYGDIQMLLPKMFGGEGAIGQAYKLSGKRILGTLGEQDLKLYQKLLQVGVVDSQVQAGEMRRLLRDILSDPAAVERGLYDKLPKTITDRTKKGLLKTYQTLQDAYVAEDDFWKVINWSLERNRHSILAGKLGLKEDNIKGILNNDKNAIASIGRDAEQNIKIAEYFQKIAPRRDYINTAQSTKEFYENFLDEVAGNLTRNQVPNYAYVGRTAKALRQTPFGNFIAFPLEIMRTGHNILQRSLDEIYSGIPELRSLGMKRLFGFGATVGGIPYGMVELFKSRHNVTDEEMQALKKFVPEWSKNSTLLPMGRDENGYLKYVDFSYSNAYDTLIRPFNSVINAISAGQDTRESTMESLGKGMQEGISELLQPYTSESIFTEALVDSTIRRGVGRGGVRVWNNEDETMVKIGKGILHIGESLRPGSLSQLKRLSQAATGKTDKYGKLFNLEDEIGSLYGFRTINSDPERALTFMTTDLGNGLRDAESIFKRSVLRGGRLDPKDIVNSFKYTQSIRYQKLREMYQNIEAARTLGVSESVIRKKVRRKGLKKKVLKELYQGVFTPERPGDFTIRTIGKNNRELNEKEGTDIPNPFYEAIPSITSFINSNRRISLEENSLNLMDFEQPTLQQEPRITTPPLNTVNINPNIVNAQSQNVGSTLPANFASLPTEEKIKLLEDRGIRIG